MIIGKTIGDLFIESPYVGVRMKKLDITSAIGFLGSWAIVGLGLVMASGWSLSLVYALYINQYDSLALTLGGSSFAVVMAYPMTKLKTFLTLVKVLFTEDTTNSDYQNLIIELVDYATEARRNGVLSLDARTADIQDGFIKNGIQLAVDGTAPEQIEEILQMEVQYLGKRHEDNQEVILKWAELAPAFGMIGTLVGLVAMLNNLSDPEAIGPAMAVAIITTLYGSIIANMYCIPAAAKLKMKTKDELLRKEIIIAAILSIQNGDNPRIVKQKLLTFVTPAIKEAILAAEPATN